MKLPQYLQRLKLWDGTAGQQIKNRFVNKVSDLGNRITPAWSDGPHVRLYAATMTAGVLLMGGSYVVVNATQSTQSWVQVYSDGAFMGVVPDQPSVLSHLNQTASAYNVNLNLYPVHMHVNPGYDWKSVSSLPTQAVAIESNGKPLVYVSTREQATNVLSQVKTALIPKDLKQPAKVAFATRVEIVGAVVSVSSILQPTAAVHYLLNPTGNGPVGRSASVRSIAQAAKTASASTDTTSPNTGTASASTAGTIQTAQFVTTTNRGNTSSDSTEKKNLTDPSSHPLLTVQAKETITKVVATKYPIHYVKTAHLGLGAIKIVHQGQPGKVQEEVEVTYVNGEATAQQVLDKKVMQEPSPEIADKGTNAGIAVGSWGWPTDRYDITSPFGWRAFNGGSFHPGVDIGVPVGSPVYATNNGVVVEAGWNSGGYGNWVMINNGDGIQSVFGHLSQVLVHAGQTVAKGDEIGKSGDTGFSTGPHLHYEIRKNGTAINPKDYM